MHALLRPLVAPLVTLSACSTLLVACGGGGSDAPPPAPTTPAGLVYGQGSVNGTQFADAQARHYRLAGNSTVTASLAATFTPQTRFDGSVSDANGPFTWTAGWDSANAGTASTSAVTGTYTGVWAATPLALPAVFSVAYYDTTQRTLVGVSTNTAQDNAALLVANRP